MKKSILDYIADAAPFLIVGALLLIVIGQLVTASTERDAARAQCYATAGKAACEK